MYVQKQRHNNNNVQQQQQPVQQPPAPAKAPINFAMLALNIKKNQGLQLTKIDPVKEKLEKFEIKEKDDQNKIKDLIEDIKKSKKPADESKKTEGEGKDATKDATTDGSASKDKKEDPVEDKPAGRPRRAGALSLDLLMKVKETVLCGEAQATEENVKNSVNMLMVQREGTTIDAKAPKKNNNYTRKPQYDGNRPSGPSGGLRRERVPAEVLAMQKIAEERMKQIRANKGN